MWLFAYEVVDSTGAEALTAAGTDTEQDPAMTIAPFTWAEDQLWHIADLGAGRSGRIRSRFPSRLRRSSRC
jgi:hypothetical protein